MGHWRTKELTIYVCGGCNLRCNYCYPGDYVPKLELANETFVFRGIDFFLIENKDKYKLNKIRFYALGEPTLNINLIKKIVTYVSQNVTSHISYEIQTNGFFNQEIAEWLKDHMDMIWVSYDGLPEIHNTQRKSITGMNTADVVERNIKILQTGKAQLGIRPTITNISIHRMGEITEYIANNFKVDAIYFHPEIKQQGKTVLNNDDIFSVSLLEFAKRYVQDVLPLMDKYKVFIGNHLTINFDESCSYYCRACLPAPQLTLDGYISACDKAPLGEDSKFRQMIFGKWNKESNDIVIYEDVVALLRARKVDNMEACKNCELRYNCAGGCLGECNFLNGDIFKINPNYCEAIKYLAKFIKRNTGLFPFLHP